MMLINPCRESGSKAAERPRWMEQRTGPGDGVSLLMAEPRSAPALSGGESFALGGGCRYCRIGARGVLPEPPTGMARGGRWAALKALVDDVAETAPQIGFRFEQFPNGFIWKAPCDSPEEPEVPKTAMRERQRVSWAGA